MDLKNEYYDHSYTCDVSEATATLETSDQSSWGTTNSLVGAAGERDGTIPRPE